MMSYSLRAAVMSLTALTLMTMLAPRCALAQVRATTLVDELDNPSGVVVHPKTGHIFVAARPAVYRIIPGNPAKKVVEVDGFKTDVYGKGPMYDIGPLGVALVGDDQLVVGDGSLPDAEEVVRVFKIGAQPPAKPQSAGAAAQILGPIPAGDASAKGEGNFYAIAVSPQAIFVTSNGDDTKGWILKSAITGGKLGPLTPFIATKPLVEVDAPVGITMSPDGKQLVVGQMGEVNMPADSLLCTYNPATGALLKSLKTGLNDIAGLAYSPKTGKLYAVDFSWIDTKEGGLFRLDVGAEGVKAEKILALDKPTALAFDKSGTLYITIYGTKQEGASAAPGYLAMIAPGL